MKDPYDLPSPHKYRRILADLLYENRYRMPSTLIDEIGLESYYRHLLRSCTDCPPSLHTEIINFTLAREARRTQRHIKGFRQTPRNFLNRQKARRNEEPQFTCSHGSNHTYHFEHMDGSVTWFPLINTTPHAAD